MTSDPRAVGNLYAYARFVSLVLRTSFSPKVSFPATSMVGSSCAENAVRAPAAVECGQRRQDDRRVEHGCVGAWTERPQRHLDKVVRT